ncbi:metallophosphoesterase [Paenibacillus doosanensis]|uniref:metallophosphoesterase family protein n=1 Tax=Paenibacillus doosanensis TaxID=1229154 RepID=UPI0021801540|nr:metallophosphoesterase [Paenibacillus doosanensis]MCS7464310.1 metallophosphoesterase [Paenibacillus doosanensis]
MKALILSDIHSNIQSLRAVWERESDSDIIYCTGDLVDCGPFPGEVIDWVRKHQVICTKGNHDERIIAHYHSRIKMEDLPDNKGNWAYHNAGCLNDEEIRFLQELPESVECRMDGFHYCMKHQFGEKYETIESIHQLRHFWSKHTAAVETHSQAKRVIFGHTHWQAVQYLKDDELWMNPGSTSYRPTRQKEDRSLDAHYITITDGQIRMKSVDYDVTPLIRASAEVHLPSYWG